MIFEEMLLEENKKAFIEKRKTKTKFEKELYELTKEYVYSEKFDDDIRRLINKDYYFDLPVCKMIRKSQSTRRRKVYIFEIHDRIVLQYLNYMFIKKYDDKFSDNLYSARKEMRTGKLFAKVRNLDPHRELYVVKSDIRKYSESIDVTILEKQMQAMFPDEPEVIDFIMWLVSRGKYYYNDEIVEGYTSVMGGNPTSAFFYNLNLKEVDEVMSEKGLLYSRYADDICIICRSKEEAEENMALLTGMVSDLNLQFNTDKSAIVAPGEDLDLLGIKFADGYTDIADNTYSKVVNKFKHKANGLNRAVQRGKITRDRAADIMVRRIDGYFYGYVTDDDDRTYRWIDRIFPYISSTERLKKIDRVSEDCIRFLKTGRKTNAKYRVRYKELQAMGFKPLVYSYYHRESLDD